MALKSAIAKSGRLDGHEKTAGRRGSGFDITLITGGGAARFLSASHLEE